MSLSFNEQLIITLVDKLAIGCLLVFAGFLFNRILERFKSQRALENELTKLKETRNLEYLDKQLSHFYWPVYIRLYIDIAIREKILDKRKDDPLLSKIGAEIEKNFILPNHDEIVRIIQSNIHLMESDGELFQEIRDYMRYVAIYKAMRAAECLDKFPEELGEPWPQKFLLLITKTAYSLQARYDRLASSIQQS
jgi:hypothetical protein